MKNVQKKCLKQLWMTVSGFDNSQKHALNLIKNL